MAEREGSKDSTSQGEKDGRENVEKELLAAARDGDVQRVIRALTNDDCEGGDGTSEASGATAITAETVSTRIDRSILGSSMLSAAENGHVDVVRCLIEHGADVNAVDGNGNTSLINASENGRLDVIRCLIEHGADVNAADGNGNTSLILASEWGYVDVVRCLIEHGADVNAVNRFGYTSLSLASRFGQVDVVRCLIELGADMNAHDKTGTTPVMHAAERGHLEVVQLLAERGVDITIADNKERLPLIRAAHGGHLNIVKYLIDRDADVNVSSLSGQTPLICATEGGHLDVVRYLVECGADTNATTQDGHSAIFFAAKHSRHDIQHYLTPYVRRTFNDTQRAESTASRHLSSWFISPFEVEIHPFENTGSVGGDYRATWLDTDVVVKLFIPDASTTTFADEVSFWHQLRHPNVVKLYGACDVGHHFFVYEYAINRSLREYLVSCDDSHRKPWKLLHQAALGLAYLHERKIVHGNLHGSNILVGSDGLAKLTDFGLSASTRSDMQRMRQTFIGSVRWQAPERLNGEAGSFAADIYSLGLCIVEAVTGMIPWVKDSDEFVKSWIKGRWDPDVLETTARIIDDPAPLSSDLRILMACMCSQDPQKRESAASIANRLERLAAREETDNSSSQCKPELTYTVAEFNSKTAQLWTQMTDRMRTWDTNSDQHQIYQGLQSILTRLEQSTHPKSLLQQFNSLLNDFSGALDADSHVNRIIRLSSTRATNQSMHALQRRLRNIWRSLGRTREDEEKQESRWSERRRERLEMFVSEISKKWVVLRELESEDDRLAFLSLLRSEMDGHSSSYTLGQLSIMRQAFDDISNATEGGVVPTVPAWFVPWYELVINTSVCLGSGGFGSVFVAKWLDSDVVVKQVKIDGSGKSVLQWSLSPWSSAPLVKPKSKIETPASKAKRQEMRRMFEREVGIWFGLSHPHIVRLFGACHVGTPFFLCEYAANGSLDKYLDGHPEEVWHKLHEAALGVQYLHERGVVHGDLKCNNIVVGSDGKAKVTDFGLSLTVDESEDGSGHKTGAWHWVAPECLADDKARPTPASDVYSLGMCIIEALRVVEASRCKKRQRDGAPARPATLPWMYCENVGVKHNVTREKKLPPRPTECTDDEWCLVEKMCRFEASERVKICTVVDELSQLASGRVVRTDLAGSNPAERRGSVSLTVSAMMEFLRGQLNEEATVSESRRIVTRVHQLLWDRLSHVARLLDDSLLVSDGFQSLIKSAKTGTEDAVACTDALAQFTETALHGYALHRRLDKFAAANFVAIDGGRGGDGSDVHSWQDKCYSFLGVAMDEKARRSSDAAAQCA